MKRIWEVVTGKVDEHEEPVRVSSALFMIILFLFFWGASFYVLLSGLS